LVSRVQGPKNTLREISLIDPENEWTDQKIINATLILGLIRILVVPNNPNTTVNQVIKINKRYAMFFFFFNTYNNFIHIYNYYINYVI